MAERATGWKMCMPSSPCSKRTKGKRRSNMTIRRDHWAPLPSPRRATHFSSSRVTVPNGSRVTVQCQWVSRISQDPAHHLLSTWDRNLWLTYDERETRHRRSMRPKEMHVLILRFPIVLVSGRAVTNGEVHAQRDVAIAMVAHSAVDSRGRLHAQRLTIGSPRLATVSSISRKNPQFSDEESSHEC